MPQDASRQLDRLRAQSASSTRVLAAEVLLVLLCVTAGALAFELWWLYLWFAVQYTLVLAERLLLRLSPQRSSRGFFALVLGLDLLIGSNFALLSVLLWQVEHDVFKFAVVALLAGSTLNTFLVRAKVWQAMLCFVVPNGAAMFAIALSLRGEGHSLAETATAIVLALAIMTYFLVCVLHSFRWHASYERTQRRLELARRSEAIGRLTGGIAHDFNNLLFVIMGNLEALRTMARSAAETDLIDRGIRATERGADLTRNILRFARQARPALRPVDLNAVVEETTRFAARTLPANIAMEIAPAPDLWQVETDASSAESALLNLLLNARDAMPGGGRIRVSTGNRQVPRERPLRGDARLPAGRYATIAISDTGPGIPDSDIARIFEPFETTKPDGTGLGLTMIEVFMRETGGGVEVETAPGRGTTFTLHFPAGPAAAARPEPDVPRAARPNAAATARVLLVEDEGPLREALLRMLAGTGHEIVPAESGDAAWALFREDPHFDLLITDVVMPGRIQGAALAARLRGLSPDLPVLFLSGHDFGALSRHPGVRAHDIRLSKPVRRARLLEAIDAALAQAGASAPGPRR